MSPERLRGLAWRQDAEARRDQARAAREKRSTHLSGMMVTVLRIANDDWHRERFGTIAG